MKTIQAGHNYSFNPLAFDVLRRAHPMILLLGSRALQINGLRKMRH